MFYATARESKRFNSLFGLIFTIALFFSLFLPTVVSATTTVWQGTGSSQSIESIIGDSLIGGNYSFGWSIDADGDTVVVGYPSYNDEAGSAYVLQHNNDGSWTRLAKLTAPVSQPKIPADGNRSAVEGARFGWSVAILGDTVVVGAPFDQLEKINQSGDTYIVNFGAAYVFTKPAGGWADSSDAIKLIGPEPSNILDGFGWSVDVANNTVVVGAPSSQANNKGSVYVYNRPTDGWVSTSSSVTILSGTVNSGKIGYSVAMDSNAKVIVAGGVNNKNQAVVFTNTSGDWSTYSGPQNLTVANLDSSAMLGTSVAVSANGDTIVVGARNDPAGTAISAGAAYVFYSAGGVWSAGDFTSIARLTASDHTSGAIFGESVAIQDDFIVVGSPRGGSPMNAGAAYIYVKPANGWVDATENVKLLDVDNGLQFQYYGQDVVFLDNNVFSVSTYISDGSSGFSLFSLAELNAPADTTPPATPTNIIFTQITTSSITISWDVILDASGYSVSSTAGTSLTTTSASAVFTNLASGTEYFFQVNAFDTVGNTSTYSNTFSTSTLTAVDNSTTTPVTTTPDNTQNPPSSGGCGSCGSSVIIPTIITVVIAELGPISTTTIHINSDVANATEMMLSENSDFIGATWQTYATNTPYVLSVGNGQKTVYVKYRSASGGVSETRNLTITIANLGGQDSPGQSSQDNVQGNQNSNNGNSGSTTITDVAPIVVAPAIPLTAGIKIVGNSTTSQAGGANLISSTNTQPLEIQLSTTSGNNNLVPTAQAGVGTGFSTKARGYFTRIFNPENNWLIALAAVLAVVVIGGGWFAYKWKKGNKNADNPPSAVKKEEKDDVDKK